MRQPEKNSKKSGSNPNSYEVKTSAVHGKGVFARRLIPAGERIIEYRGERISWNTALERADKAGQPIGHTYFFSLADGRVIDGASKGNAARYINHSCEPNCEPLEHENSRVYIYALRDIEAGEELSYYYALIYDGKHTPAVKRAFPCRCGAPSCSGSMLAPKKRRRSAPRIVGASSFRKCKGIPHRTPPQLVGCDGDCLRARRPIS